MIRVLHVLGSLNRGGSETMLMNLYRNIDRTKVQFDFVIHTEITGDYVDEIVELGGKIYSMPKYKGINHFDYVKSWNNFIENHTEYKIIHGHMRSTAAIYLRIANKYGLFTIAHSHSTSSGKGVASFIKSVMQFPIRFIADYFFACSKNAGRWLFGNGVVNSRRFRILNNAIETDHYVFSTHERMLCRKELDIENQFVIGHIGRFTEAKNHDFIIDVFNEIHKTSGNSVLMLVGDGELMNNIKEKVDKLNLSDSVIFTGVRSDIPELLSAMDSFVFPSSYEGLGIVAIEAQAAGLHTICSNLVPHEVKVTDLVDFVSLDKYPKEWADIILKYNNGYIREDTSEQIKAAGYDIHTTAKWLEKFYLKISERSK